MPGTGTHSYHQASKCLVQEPTVTIRPRNAWYRNPQIPSGLEMPGTGTHRYHQALKCLVLEPTDTIRPRNASTGTHRYHQALKLQITAYVTAFI